jgi:hypothetical protein
MYRVPFSSLEKEVGYGLGIDRWKRQGTLLLNHGGGGFGFLAFMGWYPALEIGIVTLTNSADHSVQTSLPIRIIRKIVEERKKRFAVLEKRPESGGDVSLAERQAIAQARGLRSGEG